MSKIKNPRRTVTREAKLRRRLPPDAVCVMCGESAPEVLEQHHPAGRAHDRDLNVVHCKNCHAKATEGQIREGVPLKAADSLPERVAAIFSALAAFFRSLADAFDRLANQVWAFIASLDATVPEWRIALSEEN